MKFLANKQRGMGLGGLIMVIAAVLFVVVIGMKLIPVYAHNFQIESLLKKIVNDPEMLNATVKEIRASYTKRASIDYINDLAADDVDVSKVDGHITLSASYSVKIPAVANVNFLIEFNPTATK
jgi:beta-xylosidase